MKSTRSLEDEERGAVEVAAAHRCAVGLADDDDQGQS